MFLRIWLVLLRIFFSGSSVSVLYEGEYSESWNLVRGVRQGGIISAYLFNLYIDDILTSISKTQVGCKLGLSLLSVQAYADDMILMSPTSSGLQRLLNVNKSAGFLLRKFNNADIQIFCIFSTLCSTLYGCELWIDRKGCARALKEFSVSYHAVLKKILNVPRYFSNHYVCGILSLFTFEHFINIKLTRFMLWIKNSKSDSFYRYKYYALEK